MKKFICKIVVFLFLFSAMFMGLQSVLHFRWSTDEDLYTRDMVYSIEEPKDSIDVLYFGTSELFACISPIVTYDEAGITGYNFAITNKSAITAYYQLEYALKSHTPKVVVCDFASLFDTTLPSDVEAIYRKVVDTMPDWTIKRELISTICKVDEVQSALSYYFPILRYHSMWNDLTRDNFTKDYSIDMEYDRYKKGAELMDMEYQEKTIYDTSQSAWKTDNIEYEWADISVEYYDKFINLCKEKGIRVVAVIPPKIVSAKEKVQKWDEYLEYFDSREIDYLDYNNYEAVNQRLGVSLEEHYYDGAHMNYKGAIIFSRVLAKDLVNLYNLKSHKGDLAYQEWDVQWDKFCDDYGINRR